MKKNNEITTNLKAEHSPVLPKNSPPAFQNEQENKIVPGFDNKLFIIMKTLERFLKRRPAIDVLKDKGIIQGFYTEIFDYFATIKMNCLYLINILISISYKQNCKPIENLAI